MPGPSRRRAALVVASLAVLPFAAVACGGSDDDSADTTTTVATAAAGDATTETTAADSGGDTTEPAATGTGTVTLASEKAPADRTLTFTADGALEPSTLTVKVGETFTFVSAGGIHGVKVGDADSASVSSSLFESFTIDAPGTYPVTDEISDATATITVVE